MDFATTRPTAATGARDELKGEEKRSGKGLKLATDAEEVKRKGRRRKKDKSCERELIKGRKGIRRVERKSRSM